MSARLERSTFRAVGTNCAAAVVQAQPAQPSAQNLEEGD